MLIWLVRVRLTLAAVLAGKALLGTILWIVSAFT
jgi:hypothetical protein